MSAQVQVLTLLSKTHIEQGRYAISFDVVQKKKTDSTKTKRKKEEQAYVEHECVVGGCSPEIELPLQNRKCEIKLAISGALKPQSDFEQGEDILEYNEALSECRKLLTLVPTYDGATEGVATIKLKVDDKVKHTVTVHDVPVKNDLNRSTSSSSSFCEVREAGASRQVSMRSNLSSVSGSSLEQSIDEGSAMTGSVKEDVASASGEGHWSEGEAQAVPMPPRSLDQGMKRMAIRQQGPDVVPPEEPYVMETAYDKMLCNESLNTLSCALSPADANRLVIGLGVPNQIHSQNQRNHPGDVVSGNYESLRYWRNQKRSRKQQHEATNQHLYEDLLLELDDIGRKDLKVIIKNNLELNKKLEKNDFNHL